MNSRRSAPRCSLALDSRLSALDSHDSTAPDAGSIGRPPVSLASASTTLSRLDGSSDPPSHSSSSSPLRRTSSRTCSKSMTSSRASALSICLSCLGDQIFFQLLRQLDALLDDRIARLVADFDGRVVVRRLHQHRFEHAVFVGFEIFELQPLRGFGDRGLDLRQRRPIGLLEQT